jgi:uncharacterized protein YkwD
MKLAILILTNLSFFSAYAQPDPPQTGARDSSQWETENLNTGQSVSYLSLLEKEVLLELNKVRTDPRRYARVYLAPQIEKFKGKLNTQTRVETREGATAMKECVSWLSASAKMGPLSPDKDLCNVAQRHTSAQSKTRETGHTSPNGETFEDRLRKLKFSNSAECISYGEDRARGIVISLLVDDGVPSRGHRKIILDPRYSVVGISVGSHLVYSHMCTIDFGGGKMGKR